MVFCLYLSRFAISLVTYPWKSKLAKLEDNFSIVLRIFYIDCDDQTSLKAVFVRFFHFFIRFEKLKTLYWTKKAFISIKFRYFHCLSRSLCHLANFFGKVILNFWWRHPIRIQEISTICTNFCVYIFSRILANIKYMKIFILNSTCENRYILSMQKIHISQKKNTKKKYKKCWLIQLFLESINNSSFSIMTCLLILTEN